MIKPAEHELICVQNMLDLHLKQLNFMLLFQLQNSNLTQIDSTTHPITIIRD